MSDNPRIQPEDATTGWRAALRLLWQPPARAREYRRIERQVGFLELFFDLVFVVLVAQLAHRLSEHPSWSGFGWFTFLFFTVFLSWLNGTLYHDTHGTDDVSIRVFTFAQMLTVAVMAAFAGEVPGDGAGGFAIAYAANSAILCVMWFRTGYHDPDHRQYSYPYVTAYAASTVLFFTSAFVGDPATYWLWAAAIVLQLCAGIPTIRGWRYDLDGTVATPTLIERVGLLVIIVLGEVVASAVVGMAGHETIDAEVIAVGLLGVLVAIALWWLYFDGVSRRRPRLRLQFVWGYLHFPLVLGIAAVGASVFNLVVHIGEPLSSSVRWLLVGSTALTLMAIATLAGTLEVEEEHRQWRRTAMIAVLVCILPILVVGAVSLGTIATLAVLDALLLIPVILAIIVWLKVNR